MSTQVNLEKLILTPENKEKWIGELVDVFDKICKLDLLEHNYLKKRIEEAQKGGKDGLEWSYSVLDKVLRFVHKACFKGIWGGFKGFRQFKHLEIDLQAMIDGSKDRTLPGYDSLMCEVVQASRLYKEIVNKYGDFKPMLMPGDVTETGSTCRVVLFFGDPETVLAKLAEGTADMEVMKTA